MIEADGDDVHVVQGAFCLVQAPLNRLLWHHAGGMLDPVETLLLNHADELAVDENGGGVVLANSVGNS